MGLSEDALPGVGEEYGAGVYPICPGQFLPGQRIDPCSGRQESENSASGLILPE